MTTPRIRLVTSDYRTLYLLSLAPIERRPRGWRFGTKAIADSVVARLVAAGRAEIVGDRLVARLQREILP